MIADPSIARLGTPNSTGFRPAREFLEEFTEGESALAADEAAGFSAGGIREAGGYRRCRRHGASSRPIPL